MRTSLSPGNAGEPAAGRRAPAGDADAGSALDRVARLAAYSLQAPAAVISLYCAGRLKPRAAFGLASKADPEAGRFAEMVLREDRCVVIPDAYSDSRFRHQPQVAGPGGFCFCAGSPIRTGDGWTLGVLCVFDRVPRQFAPGQGVALSGFADLVAAELSIRLDDSRPAHADTAPAAFLDGSATLFDDSSAVVLVYGFDGQIFGFNHAAERATGYSREETLPLRVQDLVAPEQRPFIGQAVLEAFGGAMPENRELTFLTKDNRQVVLEVKSRLVFRAGNPVAVQAVGRDVTLRRTVEEQRDRSVSELARFNAHLRELHRLSATSYDSLENLVGDYLRTGCEILGLAVGRLAPAGDEPANEISPGGAVCDCEPGCKECCMIQAPVQLNHELYGHLRFCSPLLPPREFGAHEIEILDLMARSIGNSILEGRMRAQLAFQATHDALTGLFNRSYQQEWLERALERAAEQGTMVAVALLDLDRMKRFNDVFGHSFGDIVLKRVAGRMAGLLSPADSLARMGGDEFTVVFTGLGRPEEAVQAAERLLAGLRDPVELDSYEFVVTASLGLAFFPADARDAETLLRHAGAAMRRAKSRGANDLECFTPEPGPPGLDQLDLETQLRHALDKRQFELLFQPQVDLKGGLQGLEVLLIWNSPKFGRVPPGRFIPVAEESGLIVPIGSWVLGEACSQAMRWQRAGCAPVRMAVNVSPLQFARTDFVETVAEALGSSGLPARWLELEITENLIIHDVEEAARRMAKLRALGVSIAIDDFGTGYSSLSYLRQLPVDTLKIDKSFLPDIELASGTLPLIRAIIVLAHDLGLSVLAEGVENQRQANLLNQAGCDRAQGLCFGGPLTVEEAASLMK
ncbi:MAG: EAL domain-containing protein [Acidobacteriota bacterium]